MSRARGVELEVRLLGALEVRRSGESLEFPPSRKTRALLAYLTATERPHTRERLCSLLWEGPVDPRRELRWSLSKLRPLLEPDGISRLVSDGDRIAFEPNGAMVDLRWVRESVEPKARAAETESLEAAAGRFRGPFVDGLTVSGCHRFDAWCTGEREAVRSLRIQILTTLGERLEARPEEALRYARDRLVLEPYSEAAHLAVIRLLGRLGRTREARKQYETCCEILRREFGARPSRELDAVRRALGTSVSAPPAVPAITYPENPLQPLTGRQSECDVIDSAIEAVTANESHPLLLFTGAPGIGKTRLLEELATRVHKVKGEVLAGRSFEAEMIRPYGPWVDALRTIPRNEVPIELREELAPLLPELGAAVSQPSDRIRLFDAVVRLLKSRADQRPVAITMDDIQWLDEASVAMLHFAVRRLRGAPVLVACAARPGEIEDNSAARQFIRALEREGVYRRVPLEALDGGDTAELVKRIHKEIDVDRVFREGEGNPLFSLEIARAISAGQGSEPETLEGLIEGRLARLDSRAKDLLPWIAAFGHGFTLDLLSRVLDLSSAGLLSAIEQLERRGIIRPAATGHDFTHDLIRRTAYGRISEPRRRLIHSRIAQALAEIGNLTDDPFDVPSHDDELAGDIAHHATLGGDNELAACASLAAARHALWLFAYDDAAELITRGVELAEDLPQARRIELHLELLGLCVAPGLGDRGFDNIENDLMELVREARVAGLPNLLNRGLFLVATLSFQCGDYSLALDRALRAEEAGREADPETVVQAISETAHCMGMLERDMDRAENLAGEAAALAENIGAEPLELHSALGYVHRYNGRLDDAVAAFTRAVAVARRERKHWDECNLLAQLVLIELERGRPADALERCRELRPVAGRMPEGSEGPHAAALEALARIALVEEDASVAFDEALRLLREVDSKAMLARVQVSAGEIDLEGGAVESARKRGEEALEAARAVRRDSTVALARALLASCSLDAADNGAAAEHLDAVSSDCANAEALSAQARNAVEAIAERLTKTPT